MERDPTDVALSGRLRSWVEAMVGGPVTAARHPAAGRSRSIHVIDTGAGRPSLVLRSSSPDSPMRDTSFTLEREAMFLTALYGGGIRVPRCYGVSDDADAMLLELLPGTAAVDWRDDDERRTVMDDYLTELVRLHDLDPATLDPPLPGGPPERAPGLADLDEYVHAYQHLCPPHADFDEAVGWLYSNAPAVRPWRSVLHGDTGPGNFLHEGGAVTGLVDFEMAHLGDPEDDLAWVWFRSEILSGDPNSGEYLHRYASLGGRTIDVERLRYYRVLVLTRCVAANLFVEGRPSSVVRAGLTRTVPWLHAVLAQAGGPAHADAAPIAPFPPP